MSAFDVEEWPGAEVTIKGKVETLPDRVQEALKKGFEDDLWTEADVPDEGTTLEEVDMLVRLVLCSELRTRTVLQDPEAGVLQDGQDTLCALVPGWVW
jgi:hypothetical protein